MQLAKTSDSTRRTQHNTTHTLHSNQPFYLCSCYTHTRTPAPQQTLVNEGFKGIYKGFSAPLATVALFNAVLFASRGQMEVLLRHTDGEHPLGRTNSSCFLGLAPAQHSQGELVLGNMVCALSPP